MNNRYRVGQGWDRHRLDPGRSLRLCGVGIDADIGTVGHSDADPVLHAVIDSLLGALGKEDIGSHFPPGDPEYENADSFRLLEQVTGEFMGDQWNVENLDLTILLEPIKLSPYRDEMVDRLEAELPGTPVVNVKFSTGEGLGPVGRGEAVDARAVVLLSEDY